MSLSLSILPSIRGSKGCKWLRGNWRCGGAEAAEFSGSVLRCDSLSRCSASCAVQAPSPLIPGHLDPAWRQEGFRWFLGSQVDAFVRFVLILG